MAQKPKPRPKSPSHILIGISAEQLAGPPELGRSVLLGSDDPVPGPWQGLPEVKAGHDADQAVTDRLHQAWRSRERLIIRWSGPLPDAAPKVSKPFHQWAVDEELPGERLAFAVTANTVSLLDSQPAFAPVAVAIELGAETVSGPSPTDGDVALRDGRVAWADGGPLDLDLPRTVGASVIPRAHLVSGSIRPLPARSPATAELAPDQLAAVEHRGGPARILAPAGSGKTRVLTERARHLINDCNLEARAVSLVAYNRRAKDEMRDRLLDVAGLDVRTLNSLALAIATSSGPFRSAAGDSPRLNTITEIEVRRLLDRVVPGRRRKKLTDPLEPWVDALSACRLGLRDPAEIEQAYGGDVAGFPEVIEAYRAELARSNAMDFDEQILRAIDRLMADPEARAVARSVAPMLLVDEFQDLTPAHLLLLRLIAGPAGEVFGVGDDDQTIYGYAGASPDWLIEFERFFPGAYDHRLTVNYRCPPDVVSAAVNLLSHNRRRVAKQIDSGADDAGLDGDGLVVLSDGDPQQNMATRISKLVADGAAPGDIAVLTRVNAALLPVAVYLKHAEVPVTRPFGLGPDVLDRSGVGAALSWLRLAVGPAQGFRSDDLRLALRRPPRSLHPRVTDWVCEQPSTKQLLSLAGRLNKEKEAESVAEFASDIESLRAAVEDDCSTEDLLTMIYEEIGLLGAASQLDRSQRSARRAAHADELAALVAVAALHPDPESFEPWLRSELDSIPMFDPEAPADAVTLATIHTTKGLEWPHVVVHDVRDGLYPHRLAEDVEEERRIFHVAVTRGRESVAVTVSGPPSPFVAQLADARPADQPWPEDAESGQRTLISSKSAPKGPARERTVPAGPGEAAMRDALTEWRRQRCKDDGVPAYVVLDNKTLDAIAAVQPADLGQLGAISGIGPAKLERYGADILGIVASSADST